MTTTTKANSGKPGSSGNSENGSNGAAKLGDGWDDAPRVSSGSESEAPAWVPHWSTYKDEVVKEKMTTVPEGSHADPVIIGQLVTARAFGELRYFVDQADKAGKVVRMALPLHGSLTAALDHLKLDPSPKVRIGYSGRAKRAKPGQQAAFLYDVRCQPGDAFMGEPRKDALLPIHKANKEKRDAENDAVNE